MKNSIFAILIFGALFFTACSSNNTEQFLGTWSGTGNCDGFEFETTMTISMSSVDDNTVNIKVDDEPPIVATVDGNDITLVPSTVDGETTYGSGSINDAGTSITVEVLYEADEEVDSCNAVYTR